MVITYHKIGFGVKTTILNRYFKMSLKNSYLIPEVSKSKEVAKAIADNGDFKGRFYTEKGANIK
jgi:hypothetical protein